MVLVLQEVGHDDYGGPVETSGCWSAVLSRAALGYKNRPGVINVALHAAFSEALTASPEDGWRPYLDRR